MSGDVLLAILLITAPPGTPEPLPADDAFPALRESVHKVAVEWELLDTRELSYIFAKRRDFDNDLNLLRSRYQDFKDAPRLWESNRLPDRKMVDTLINFNRAYRKFVAGKHELRLDQDRDILYERVITETDQLYKVWDAVRDARCEFYYVTVRRQALMRLKEMLGEDEYRTMNLPPNVPTWRFRENP